MLIFILTAGGVLSSIPIWLYTALLGPLVLLLVQRVLTRSQTTAALEQSRNGNKLTLAQIVAELEGLVRTQGTRLLELEAQVAMHTIQNGELTQQITTIHELVELWPATVKEQLSLILANVRKN